MTQDRHSVEVELFQELDVNRPEAACLVALAHGGEAPAGALQAATGMSQPHVSQAVQRLRGRGWVTYRVEKRPRAGRPRHLYALAKPLPSILEEVRRQEEQRHRRRARAIQRLEGLTGLRRQGPRAQRAQG